MSERMPLPLLGQQDLSTLERVGENLAVLPVHQHDPLRVASLDEPNEVVVARVLAEVELLPLALDVDRDAVQLDLTFFPMPSSQTSCRALASVRRTSCVRPTANEGTSARPPRFTTCSIFRKNACSDLSRSGCCRPA